MPITLNGKVIAAAPPKAVKVIPQTAEPKKEEAKVEEVKKEEISAEDLEEQRRAFVSRQFGLGEPAKKKEKPKKEEKLVAKEEPKEEADKPEEDESKTEEVEADKKPAKKAKPAEAKAEKKVEKADEDVDDGLADLSGEDDLEPRTPNTEAKKAPVSTQRDVVPDEFSFKQQRILKNLAELESIDTAYAGAVEKYKKFWKIEDDYIKTWEKENPGQKYNAKDHEDFYEKHEPWSTDEDFDEKMEVAKESRITREAEERGAKRSDEKFSKQEVAQQMQAERPEILSRSKGAIGEFVKHVSEDLFKHIAPDGEIVINAETAKALEEADPIAFEVLNESAKVVECVAYELEHLMRFPKSYRPNEDFKVKLKNGPTIRPHAMLMEFADQLEKDVAALPREDSNRGGKKFMTQVDYQARVTRINEANIDQDRKRSAMRDLQSKFYTLGMEDVRRSFIADQAEQAAEKIEKLNRLADRKHKKNGAASKSEVKSGEVDKENETEQRRAKPRPPSSLSPSDRLAGGKGDKETPVSSGELIANRTFGG